MTDLNIHRKRATRNKISNIMLLIGGILATLSAATAKAESVEKLIEKLESPSFLERVEAQRELTSVAGENLNLLEQSVLDSGAETTQRILEAIEYVFLKDDGKRGEEAEKILQRLAKAGGTASVTAGHILLGNAKLRESRARIALEAKGAQFSYFSPFAISNGREIFASKAAVLPEVGVEPGPAAILHSVYIHHDWTGTKEDLWHFTRLSHHQDLAIYSIKGNSVDLNDLFLLSRDLRGLTIQERGACLGVTSSLFPNPCQVGEVAKNGPADKGGLQPQDYVFGLDETPIRSFPHLVMTLQDYNIGDEVTFTIRRGNEILEKKVTLGSWRDASFNRDKIVDTPPDFVGPLGKPLKSQPVDKKPIEPTEAK